MTGRITYRLNAALERYLPEQRLFLRSDTETRFIRLSPTTQALTFATGALVIAWTILATAMLMMDSIGAGNAREQTRREQLAYEARLNALSADRDSRTEEAARAQQRFNVALAQVSQMQSALLASEDRREELETGIEVIQKTLQRAIHERDAARADLAATRAKLVAEAKAPNTRAGRIKDVEATLDVLTRTLAATATQRDQIAADAAEAKRQADQIALDKRLMEDRNNQIFDKLEQAVTVSMKPLDKMFRAAGLSTDKVLKEIRRGYSGQGGPLTPITFTTKGEPPTADEIRANEILAGLDKMNLYRLAAQKVPVGLPLKTSFRFTSPFGWRSDPIKGTKRFHEGLDMAGRYGSPIYATADGVVVRAGWSHGYGRLVVIRHAFGFSTRYGHMSQIRVKVGQRVSRGQRIGDMGNSGRSTGTHLHYEVRTAGKAVNPMTYIKAAAHVF
ncbi:DUF5930 domain-containing protein [Acidimangrovimonas pyrenivorans]|uniref:DUF5930 domain-containing protein n=1 Tax=Acidimangrovimonas pyrenivorans TaxID=2030798 RepID=A0ABV7ACS4_9RHOB